MYCSFGLGAECQLPAMPALEARASKEEGMGLRNSARDGVGLLNTSGIEPGPPGRRALSCDHDVRGPSRAA